MLEDLRKQRNTLQTELSARKADGSDTAGIIQQMKEISTRIKSVEKQKKPAPRQAPAQKPQTLPSAEFFLCDHKAFAVSESELTCSTSQTGTPEFENAIRELEKFEAKNPTFPQNSTTWLLNWHQSRPNEILKLSLVKDTDSVIAAFWHAERRIGPLRILYSAPIGSCDFFDVPMSAGANPRQVISVLFDTLRQSQQDLFFFKNVNSHSSLYQGLNLGHCAVLSSSKIHTRWLSGETTPTDRLSSKLKYAMRSKRKKLDAKWGAEAAVLKRIATFAEYQAREQAYADIFRERWGTNVAEDVSARRTSVLRTMLATGGCRVYEIHVGGEIAGYKIGFIHRNVFWEWKSCIKVEFNPYSLNHIFISDLMEKLHAEGLLAYNFMAGDYDYKRRWADDGLQTTNYHFLIGNSTIGRLAIPAIIAVKNIRDAFRETTRAVRKKYVKTQ